MRILLVVAFVAAVCGVQCASQLLSKLEKSNRQKRLLFYDDQGHLMKNYANTLYHVGPKTQENLFQWSFLNTFLSPIFPNLGRTSIAYMVPVSDAVVQQINKDPIYQNKLLYLTYLDPIVQANPLCNGKRTQIPSSNLCNNYVNCWDGWGFEQECPPGLLFSTDGFCDYPMNVNCHNRKLKNPNPLCDNDFQATVNSANCNEFFICVNSIPVRFKCPGDLSFSEKLGVCDFPSRVDCNSTNEATLSPSNPQIVQLSTQASTVNAPVTPGPVIQEAPLVGNKNMGINKLEYNTQTWSSTHMAISRQDAIRQLNLGSIDEASMKN